MTSSIGRYVRNGSTRLSHRFSRELNREWIPKFSKKDQSAEVARPRRKDESYDDGNVGGVVASAAEASISNRIDPTTISERRLRDDDGAVNGETCIICIGSTGAGKSSTISKCTLQRAKSSSGTERETKKCAIYRRIDDVDGPVWVDTIGWDDVDCEDSDNFKDVLRFIDRNDITKLKCIIWNVIPNVRRDALLSKQAALIDLFKPTQIWNNVIIVLKQSMNPENDGKGAIRAALEFNVNADIQLVGYRFLEDPTISEAQRESLQDPKTREIFNVKTNEEIRCLIDEKLSNIKRTIQVVFHNSKCIDCGQTGDERLMTSFCHMEPFRIHPGVVEQFHPKRTEMYHPSQHYVYEHDGFLKKPWYSVGCLFPSKRYSCCNKRFNKVGCTAKWACCKTIVEAGKKRKNSPPSGCKSRYKCCKTQSDLAMTGCRTRFSCCLRQLSPQLVAVPGCKKVCKKCDAPWGTLPGNCFKKNHTIRDIHWTDPAESNDGKEEREGEDEKNDEEDSNSIEDDEDEEQEQKPIIYHVF